MSYIPIFINRLFKPMIKLKDILKEIKVVEDVNTDVQNDEPRIKFSMPQAAHVQKVDAQSKPNPFFVSKEKDISKAVQNKAADATKITFDDKFVNKMADAIYKAEGGEKAKSPYGVLSIKLKGKTPDAKKAEARQITINSIRNNWKRWQSTDKKQEFVDFMADRWCPPSADPVGNRNWKNNVKRLLEKS